MGEPKAFRTGTLLSPVGKPHHMDESRRQTVEFAGVTLALVAAGLHLVWGGPRLAVYISVGRLPDLRPALFVISSIAVVFAVIALYRGTPERPVYALLIGIMAVYIAGYIAWHLAGHPILGPGGVQLNYHPPDPVTVVVTHLQNDLFALVSMLVEISALVVLTLLLANPQVRGQG